VPAVGHCSPTERVDGAGADHVRIAAEDLGRRRIVDECALNRHTAAYEQTPTRRAVDAGCFLDHAKERERWNLESAQGAWCQHAEEPGLGQSGYYCLGPATIPLGLVRMLSNQRLQAMDGLQE
jgi:hypothetical protein